jgi:hypothetical protein
MKAMSKDELVSFLSQGTYTAKLATVKRDICYQIGSGIISFVLI